MANEWKNKCFGIRTLSLVEIPTVREIKQKDLLLQGVRKIKRKAYKIDLSLVCAYSTAQQIIY